MAKQIRSTLKGYFETGKKPTENNYIDLIDSHIILDSENTGSLNLQGNTTLGDSSAHTHTFTGHITASGDISSSGILSVGDGSATNPSITFGSDPNTGIYKHSDDQIGLVAGGKTNIQFGTNAVNIKFNDSIKLSTTNTGISITGNVITTGNSTFGDDGSETHTFTGAITSSHAISSSGIITADQFVGDGSLITNITSSLVNITAITASLATGSLFLTGSSTYASASTSNILLGLETTGSILPGSDGESDLGSPTKYWKDLFVSRSHAETFVGTFEGAISGAGQISGLGFLNNNTTIAALDVGIVSSSAQISSDISGSLSATSVAALDLGILSSSAQLPTGTITSSNSTATFKVSGSQHYTSGSTSVLLGAEVTGSILPGVSSNGTTGFDLGSPTAVWRDLFLSENSLKFVSSSGLVSRFEQKDVEDLRAGRPLKQAAKTVDAAGEELSIDGLTSYIRPQAIYHPTDDETVLLLNTAGKLLYRTAGGDPFSIRSAASGFADIKLGSTTTAANRDAHTGAIGFGTVVRIPGHISASNDKTEHHIAGAVKIYSGSNQVWLFGSGSATQQGGISASGTIIANKIEADSLISHAGDANTGLQFASDTVQIEGNNVILAQLNTTRINLNKQITGSGGMLLSGELESSNIITGPITASGGISASGDLHVGNTIFMGTNPSASFTISGNHLALNEAAVYNGVIINRSSKPQPIIINGSITASGDISSSGALKIQGGSGNVNYITAEDGGPEVNLTIGTKTAAVLGLTVEGAISASGEIKSTTSASFSSRIAAAESELGNTLISSSAQLASDISGSFTAASSSFSTRIAAAESELGNTLISSSVQIASDISGSFTAASSSISTRLVNVEAGSTSKTLISGSDHVFTAITSSGDVSASGIVKGLSGSYTRLDVETLEVSGSDTFTNWNNFRNRFSNDNKAFEVSTDPTVAGGFREGMATPNTGSAPHLHFMLSGSGQAGVGLLNPKHTLHVSTSNAGWNGLYVEGVTSLGGNTLITGSTTISGSGTPSLNVLGEITSSGNISSSGDIITKKIGIPGVNYIDFSDSQNTIDISSDDSNVIKIDGDSGAVLVTGLSATTFPSNQMFTVAGTISASGHIQTQAGVYAEHLESSDDLVVNGVATLTTASIGDVSSSLIPDTDNIWDLGSSTHQWKVGHITTASVAHLQSKAGGVVVVSGSLNPQTDDTWDLGSSTKKWKDLYVDGTGSFDDIHTGIIKVNRFVSSSLLPPARYDGNPAQFSLGATHQEWKDLFIDGTANIDLGLIDSASIGVVSSSLLPDADDTWDLGSSTKEWRNLYIDGTAYIDTIDNTSGVNIITASIGDVSSSLLPDADDTYDLGSSTKEWRNLHLDGTANIDLGLVDSASIGKVSSSLLPDASNTYDLGSSTLQWKDLHVDGTAHIDTIGETVAITTASVGDVSSSLIPDANNVFDLGSTTKTWGTIYANAASFNSITTSGSSVLSITSASISYLSGSSDITVGAAMVPDLNVTHNLGSSTFQWNTLHASTSSVNLSIPATASISVVSSSLLPFIASGSSSTQADTFTLGNATQQWSSSFIHTAYINNLGSQTEKTSNIHVNTSSLGVISSSLNPDADDTYDLGSSTLKWKDLYIDGTAYIDNINYINGGAVTASGDISGSGNLFVEGSASFGNIKQLTNTLLVGNITASNGSPFISGSGTEFTNLNVGDAIKITSASVSQFFTIADIGSNVSMSLDSNWTGGNVTGSHIAHIDPANLLVVKNGDDATRISIDRSGNLSSSNSATASFGYYIGDGTNLTGVTADWDGTRNGNAEITGSLVLSGSGTPTLNVLGAITASGLISSSATIYAEHLYSSDDAVIDDDLTVSGVATLNSASIGKVSSSLLPDADDTYDLGSTALQWKDLHLDGTANIDTLAVDTSTTTTSTITTASISDVSSSLIPDADGTYDLGSSTKEWKDLYLDGTANIDFTSTDSASIGKVSSSLLPDGDDHHSLGSSTLQWKDLYLDGTANIDLGLVDSASIKIVSSSLTPDADDTWNLGTSALQWKDLHLDGTANIDLGLVDSASIGVVSSSLNPDADDTWSLGSSTLQWKDLYLDGTANIDLGLVDSASIGVVSSSLNPDANNTWNLGSSTLQWKDLYVDGTAYIDTIGETVAITTASMGVVSSSINPDANNIYDLGSTALKWKNINATSASITKLSVEAFGEITASGNISSSATVTALSGSFSNLSVSAFGNINSTGNITASNNISSSGIITGLSGSFSELNGNSPLTVNAATTFTNPITSSAIISSSTNIISPNINALTAATSSYTLNSATSSLTLASTFNAFTASANISTGSNIFSGSQIVTGSMLVTGSLTVSGSGTLTNIGPFTQNGDSIFSGSLELSGSDNHITASGNISASGNIIASAGTFTTLNTGQGDYELYNMNQNVTTTSDVAFNRITASIDLKVDGNSVLGNAAGDTHTITGKTSFTGPITASTHISSSVTSTASFGRVEATTFSGDGSSLTGITAEWDGTHNGDAQITGSLTLSGSGTPSLNVLGNITASGLISSSGAGTFGGDVTLGPAGEGYRFLASTDTDQNVATFTDITSTNAGMTIVNDAVYLINGGNAKLTLSGSRFGIGTQTPGESLEIKAFTDGVQNTTGNVRAEGHISASSFISETHITASGNISSSDTITALSGSFSNLSVSSFGQITASGDISSSATVTALSGSFTHITVDTFSNITSSANISASGTITAEHFHSSDDVQIDDDLTVSGTSIMTTASIGDMSSSLIPDANNVFDLGSTTKKWRNAHVDGTGSIDNIHTDLLKVTTVSSSLIPQSDNHWDLGNSGQQWKDLYIDGTANIDLGLIDSASIGKVSSSLLPDADDTYDLGSSALKWKDLYVDGVTNTDSASIGKVSSSLTPDASDIYDLGTTALKWKDINAISASIDRFANVFSFTHITASSNISASGTITGLSGSFTNLSVGSFGNITASGNISASATSTGSFGTINVDTFTNVNTTHVTASGNISSSGTVTGLSGSFSHILGNSPITVQDTITFQSHVTASNNISSSATITANELVISSNITASGNISASGNIFSNGLIGSNGSTTLGNSSDDTHTFTGNITASSNISASGIITAEGLLISDDATITDDLTVSGIATVDSASIGKVSSSLTPDADDTYDLGTSDLQWKNLYVDGVANIDFTTTTTASISKVSSSLVPDGDSAWDLGSSTLEWKDLYVDGTANIDTISSSATHINAASATASLHTSGAFSDVIFKNLPITKPTVTGSLWLSGSAGQDSKYLVVFTG